MRFGTIALAEAHGAYLAHSARTVAGVLRKGTLLGAEEVAALAAAGFAEVIAARLDPGDVHEDDAARRLATAVAGPDVVVERAETGRANLLAARAGLVMVDAAGVETLNAIDPALTLATLRPFLRVAARQIVGTVKVIPFAAPEAAVAQAETTGALLRVAPWRLTRAAAISTTLPTLKRSVIDKTVAIFASRLAEPSAAVVADLRVPHAVAPLAAAIAASNAQIVVVFGASAVVDADDVIPAAIRAAGGRVVHLGMPVDPGNLLVLGEVGGRPVVGAPGCARSPKENGFDFVLDRLLAGLTVTGRDIVGMGVGGLLTDTAARPRPRRSVDGAGRPAAIVLAAGRSSRMGSNKLVAEVGGVPMVRRVAQAALASRASPVVVVTGNDADRVAAALSGLDVRLVHNGAYADGLSTSLKAGLAALPETADAALVLLGDMPLVRGEDCDAILAALAADGILVALATADGKRGNPVAWSRRLFPELRATEGDAGGRALLSRYADQVAEVEIGVAAAMDADTPAALEAVRARAG